MIFQFHGVALMKVRKKTMSQKMPKNIKAQGALEMILRWANLEFISCDSVFLLIQD